jgi:hypothetical protein
LGKNEFFAKKNFFWEKTDFLQTKIIFWEKTDFLQENFPFFFHKYFFSQKFGKNYFFYPKCLPPNIFYSQTKTVEKVRFFEKKLDFRLHDRFILKYDHCIASENFTKKKLNIFFFLAVSSAGLSAGQSF